MKNFTTDYNAHFATVCSLWIIDIPMHCHGATIHLYIFIVCSPCNTSRNIEFVVRLFNFKFSIVIPSSKKFNPEGPFKWRRAIGLKEKSE